MVKGASSDEVWKKIIGFHNDAAGRQLSVLQDVYKSESDTNQRNQAIGALMLAYGYIKDNWQQAVDLYTRQCSIGVNAKDLGVMAATLAFGGKNPVTGKQVMVAVSEMPSAASRYGIFATDAAAACMPWLSRPCIGLAPGANGSPRRRPSGVFPVALP